MPLPSSGPLRISDIPVEFGGSAPHSLSEYYGVAAGIPTSGTIRISNFYGASVPTATTTGGTITEVGGFRYHWFGAGGTFTITGASADVQYFIVGGGGGSGGGRIHGGAGGGGVQQGTMTFAAGETATVAVGLGGQGVRNWYRDSGSSGVTRRSAANVVLQTVTAGGGEGSQDRDLGDSRGGNSGTPQSRTGGAAVIGGDGAGCGGGAGAGGNGGNGVNLETGGAGGTGITLTGWGTFDREYAGGGGGNGWWYYSEYDWLVGTGGAGRGGGGNGYYENVGIGPFGEANTGGGAGGEGWTGAIIEGGSGIVILRLPI